MTRSVAAEEPILLAEAATALAEPHADPHERISEWRLGWTLVLVSLLGYAISTTHSYTLGVFMPSLESEFGWSRAQVSSGMLAYSIVAAVFAPFAGVMIDRFGVRRVGLPGMTGYCIALGLLSTVAPPLAMWWGLWCLIGVGSVLTKATLWGTAISRQFDRQRGIAMAIVLCGSSLCSAIGPTIAHGLIEDHGWRTAYRILALGNAAVILPLMFLFFRNRGSAAPVKKAVADESPAPLNGMSARDSILSYRFLAIAVPALLMTTILMGMVVHFVPMMTASGLDAATAAGLMGALGMGSIVGRLITGVLLDRFRGHVVGALIFLMPVLPIALILLGPASVEKMILVATLTGFSFGSEMDITIYLASRYFGMRAYGTILGTIIAVMLIGTGAGSTLAGHAFDMTGSYDIFLMAVAPLVVLASMMTRSLGPYPDFSEKGQG